MRSRPARRNARAASPRKAATNRIHPSRPQNSAPGQPEAGSGDDAGQGFAENGDRHGSPVVASGSPADTPIQQHTEEAAEPEWELVPAGDPDSGEVAASGGRSERGGTSASESGSELGPGRRPRRVPPERRRASEQNMSGLQAKSPSWQQGWQQGGVQTPGATAKRVWKAGVGYVDVSQAEAGSNAGNGLSKNLLARPGRAPRRSPREESSRPERAAQPVEPIAAQPVVELGAELRDGRTELPKPGLASPVSLSSRTPVRRPHPASRIDAPEPVLPEPTAPQPPAMDQAIQGFARSVSPIEAPTPMRNAADDASQDLRQQEARDQNPRDMAALAAAVEDRAEPAAEPTLAPIPDTDTDQEASTTEVAAPTTSTQPPAPIELSAAELSAAPDLATAPEPASPVKPAVAPEAVPGRTRRKGELEPIERLVATIPVPMRPVDSPPGPLYGLASVAAHIPAPVTLLRQPEMRLRGEAGVIGAIGNKLLEDPCLRPPEPEPGNLISRSALRAVAPCLAAEGKTIEAGLDTLPVLRVIGGEPPAPDSGPEVLRKVAQWLAKDVAPAPPPELSAELVAADEIQPLMGPVLPVELASLEGAGMSSVLQELSPSREEPKGSPKLNGMVMVAVTVVCLGLSALVFGSRGGSEPAPVSPPQQELVAAEVPPPPPSAADEPAPPVEVTGFRLIPGENGKAEIHYLVVNHNGEAIDPVTVNVTLSSDRVTIPVAEFSFKAPALGPYESREMVSPVEGLSDEIDMSVWRNLDAKVRLADPGGPAK